MANLSGKKIRFNQSTEYNTALTTYSAGHVYFTNNNNDTNNNAIILEGKIYGAAPMVELQYSQLTALVANKKLIPGTNYKITNYVTTTSQEGTQSAGIPFDIIVTAISNDALSEDAKADYHGTYFSQENISAWELKYCLYNDTTRFGWASSTGTGVIYYMKDEFKNEAWYDFKNIKFLRTADFFNTNSFLPHLAGDNYYYTFSKVYNNEIIDISVYNESNTYAINNHIGIRGQIQRKLTDIIFINSNGVTRNNIIGDSSYSCTFGNGCHDNIIADYCYNNVIGNDFKNNNIKQLFTNNKVTGTFQYNILGIQCYNNSFSGHIWFTTFGSQFNYCSFNIPEGSKLEYCEFGSGIGFLNGIPAIRKVTFENNVAWYDTTTYVSNLQTIDGRTLEEALIQEHDEQFYVYKVGDKYGVTSFSEMQKSEPVNIPTLVSNPGTLNDNANNYGYVGTLKNLGVTGDIIIVDTITSYVRTGSISPNSTTPVWCRLLKDVNGIWKIVYQSIDSKKIGDYSANSPFSFKMERKANDNITINDKIAIVYSFTDDITNILYCTQLGLRTITGKSGGLNNVLKNGITVGASNYQPALTINYLSMSGTSVNAVTIEDVQTITGEKTFTQNIKINEKDIIISGDTAIKGNVDAGEFKVFDNRTANKGFTIRTESTKVNDLYPVQLLATNNVYSVQYKFPLQGPESHTNSALTYYPINKPINVITEYSYATPSRKGIAYICDAFRDNLSTQSSAYINSDTALSTISAKCIVDNLIACEERVVTLEYDCRAMSNELNGISYDFNIMSTATAEALVDLDNRINNISFDSIQKQINANTTAITDLNERLTNLETLVNKIADALTIK